jgi:hypothetical protein
MDWSSCGVLNIVRRPLARALPDVSFLMSDGSFKWITLVKRGKNLTSALLLW